MNTVPIELPVKASEAAAVADLLFQHAEGRKLTDDLRVRLGGRVAGLGLQSITPYFGSLAADPVHSSTYYLAADGLSAFGTRSQILLHIAMASAPMTALFPNPLLIGRLRPAGMREIVVNAIPFSPEDSANIRAYADRVDRAFLPRAQGPKPVIAVHSGNAAVDYPRAFDVFRQLLRSTSLNLAGFDGAEEVAEWAAIRAGWRDGFVVSASDESPRVDASQGVLETLILEAAARLRARSVG